MGESDLYDLRERAKELRAMYQVTAAVAQRDEPPHAVFESVLAAIPPAFQYPEITTARIEYFSRTHARGDFEETPWKLRSPISVWRTPVGAIEVCYLEERRESAEGPFLREERELLDAIAQRIGEYLEWKHRELGGERIGAAPDHWRWRQRFAERIAANLDPSRFGVEKLYLHGSTEHGTAGLGSDIDLLIAFSGSEAQRRELEVWLEAWSLCLAEVSLQVYGVPSRGLLDVRISSPEQTEQEVRALGRRGIPPRELPLRSAR